MFARLTDRSNIRAPPQPVAPPPVTGASRCRVWSPPIDLRPGRVTPQPSVGKAAITWPYHVRRVLVLPVDAGQKSSSGKLGQGTDAVRKTARPHSDRKST